MSDNVSSSPFTGPSIVERIQPVSATKVHVPFYRRKRFILAIAIPNILSICYFGVVRKPEYVSNVSIQVTNPDKDSDSLTTMLAGNAGASMAGAYVVKEFVEGWDEYKAIDSKFDLAKLYSKYDFTIRFGSVTSGFCGDDVSLWKYWKRNAVVKIDENSGIVKMQVFDADPNVAHKIAEQIVDDTRKHINALNNKDEAEFMLSVRNDVRDVSNTLANDEKAMTDYRKAIGVYDPSLFYTAMMDRITTLDGKRIDADAKAASLAASTPNNPAIQAYGTQLNVIKNGIETAQNEVGKVGSYGSQYDSLKIKREIDAKLLQSAQLSLQESMIKANQNHYNMHMISNPSNPHGAEYPARLFWIMMFLVFYSLPVWVIIRP